MFDGVIGSKVAWGIKNSPPSVKICKSRPDLTPVIALTVSVAKVTMMASSSSPSATLKSKKFPTLEPNNVDGCE